jgi:hypothetical protein
MTVAENTNLCLNAENRLAREKMCNRCCKLVQHLEQMLARLHDINIDRDRNDSADLGSAHGCERS